MSTEPVKVICFATPLQVLIPKELEGNIIPAQNSRICQLRFVPEPFVAGRLLGRSFFFKKKKGEGSRPESAESYENYTYLKGWGGTRRKRLGRGTLTRTTCTRV